MKLCPFCRGDAEVRPMRGALGDKLFAAHCRQEQCLAVGPIGRSETEAEQKWNERNLNLRLPGAATKGRT